jgi:hypothetical protein
MFYNSCKDPVRDQTGMKKLYSSAKSEETDSSLLMRSIASARMVATET